MLAALLIFSCWLIGAPAIHAVAPSSSGGMFWPKEGAVTNLAAAVLLALAAADAVADAPSLRNATLAWPIPASYNLWHADDDDGRPCTKA